MEELMDVASYVYNKYEEEYGEKMEEAKLQKVLYFAQRESFVQHDEPLFCGIFYGNWGGPALKEISLAYEKDVFKDNVSDEVVKRMEPVVKRVFDKYAARKLLSLTRLTRGEVSWKNARRGIPDYEPSDNPMQLDDIRIDAKRIRDRRAMRMQLGLL